MKLFEYFKVNAKMPPAKGYSHRSERKSRESESEKDNFGYLEGRYKTKRLKNTGVNTDVPEGSVLGSLLFISMRFLIS